MVSRMCLLDDQFQRMKEDILCNVAISHVSALTFLTSSDCCYQGPASDFRGATSKSG